MAAQVFQRNIFQANVFQIGVIEDVKVEITSNQSKAVVRAAK